MEKVKFTDLSLNVLPSETLEEKRFAVDLGIRSYRFGKEQVNVHLFCSAKPLARNLEWHKVCKFLRRLRDMNPDVRFSIPNLDIYNQMCKDGIINGSCWRKCNSDDFEGEGNVYVVFGFAPEAKKHPITLP